MKSKLLLGLAIILIFSAIAYAAVQRGDILVRNASAWVSLPIGANGTFLGSNGTDPSWMTVPASGISGTVSPSQGGTGANNTATSGRYLRGNGSAFITSSVAAAGAGACTDQFVRSNNDNAVPTCDHVHTNDISDAVVTYVKIQDVSAASRLLGRGDSGAGDVEEIILGTNLTMAGTTLNAAGGYYEIQEDGVPLIQRQDLNFTGTGVTCSDVGGVTQCNIPGSSGSGNFVEVSVDFGTGNTNVSTTVTGQSWVTSTSKIICSPTMLSTSDRAEGAEDAIIEGITVAVHSRSAGTGFTLSAAAAQGRAYGAYKIHCTGA